MGRDPDSSPPLLIETGIDQSCRALVERTPDAMVVSLEERLVFVNPASVRLLGAASREDLLGRSLFRLIEPPDRPALKARTQTTLEQRGQVPPLECRWRRLDGSSIDIDVAFSSITWRGRSAVLLTGRRGSPRSRLRQELLEEEARLRAVLESSRDVAYRRSLLTDSYDYLSPSAERVLGISPRRLGALSVASLLEHIHPDDRPHITEALRSSGQDGEALIEYRLRGDDGVYRWIEDHFLVHRDGEGHPVSWTGMARDVTERKERERALQESEERFRTVVDLVPDLLWRSDAAGYTTWYNQRWTDYTGQSREEAEGWGWVEVIHPDDRDPSHAAYAEAVRTGRPFQHENRIRRRDGVYRWFLARAHPMVGADGTTRYWFGSATDVHEQRTSLETMEQRIEERTSEVRELAAMLTVAEQEERRRLAQLLHDDLQQILVALQIRLSLAGGRDDEAGPWDQIERSLDLLDRALALTRHLTVGLRPPILEEEGLIPAFEWLKVEMADLHGLDVEIRAAPDADVVSPRMRVLLFQVVREFLFNVAKHAGTSEARVEMERHGNAVTVAVIDAGRGFEPDAVRRPEDSVPTGFGIFSARERLRLQGGDLEIRSERGHGTRVVVTAPADVSP